jgi:hypothetical protein
MCRKTGALVGFCWLALLPGPMRAQEPQLPIVIPKISFAAETAVPDFKVGTAIEIHVDGRDLDRAGGAASLQARILRGSLSALKNKFHHRTADGCLFFKTTVLPVGRSAVGVRLLLPQGGQALTLDNGWLSRPPEAPGQSQTFVLILEKKGPFNPILKIRPEDAGRYFDAGIELVVSTNRPLERHEQEALVRSGEAALAEMTVEAEVAARPAADKPPGSGPGEVVVPHCLTYSKITQTGWASLEDSPCRRDVLALAEP